MKKAILGLILVCFFVTSLAGPFPYAQADDFRLPGPGVMVHLSPEFNPPILKGIKVHPENPFRFDFILDQGDRAGGVVGAQAKQSFIKQQSTKLIKYFLASLTIPEQDLWVNLSPYEKDRIIPQSFGLTEMGRDLLAEDYMLKQITASLIYPEGEVGKVFWRRIYQEAVKKFNTTNIPVNTYNKVWIVPEKAVVYENAKAGTAYVVEAKLKVMLEEDYLSLFKHESPQSQPGDMSWTNVQILREIVIPQLIKEVNEDKNFITLRQVLNSLILATWYKKKIKDSILAQVYADKNKIIGLSSSNASIGDPERIYKQYLKAFKKGVYNFIKEEQDPLTQQIIPRKYFSGGMLMGLSEKENTDLRMSANFQVISNKAMINRINRRDFTKIMLLVAAEVATEKKALGQTSGTAPVLRPGTTGSGYLVSSSQGLQIRSRYLGFFRSPVAQYNPRTGLCLSHVGDPNVQFTETYDMSLRMLADINGDDATNMLNTYDQEFSGDPNENSPKTFNLNYSPPNGFYSFIRINNFGTDWWNQLEWIVRAGDNAWLGNAAVHKYVATRDPRYANFARRRADYLLSLEDMVNGGIRYASQMGGEYSLLEY